MSSALPNVPAMSTFVPGYEAGSWYGLAAPRGVPDAIVARLNDEVREGLVDPTTRAKLDAMGATPVAKSAGEFGQFIAAETARYGEVIRMAGLRAG